MSHEHDHGMDMSYGGMSMNHMMMSMSFYWGKDATVLFSGWPGQSLGMYLLALFFVFSLALSIEVLSGLPLLKPGTAPIVGGLIGAGVYALRMGFAYLVMLSIMSFNLGIFVAAVAGHTVGFCLIKIRDLALKRAETTASTDVNSKA